MPQPFEMLSDRVTQLAAVALGALSIGGALALELGSSEAIAQDNIPRSLVIPNAWELVNAAQTQAKQDNPNLTFIGPDARLIKIGVEGAANSSQVDDIKRVTISKTTKGRSFNVQLLQANARGDVTVASFQNRGDTNPRDVKTVGLSIDGDVFAEKKVRVTPMVRYAKGKFQKWGQTVVLKNWDNLAPANVERTIVNEKDYQDMLHLGSVTVTPRHLTASLLRSGRFYIDVTQSCKLREKSYNASDNAVTKSCTSEQGILYRVNAGNRPTTFIAGRPTAPEAEFGHTRKVKN